MAKKEDTPSLTATRVWKAIKAGSLEVKTIPGTRMLLLVRGRIRLTWREGDKKKHTSRRLRRIYLNPRWISLPKDYPIPISELYRFNKEELATLGIVCLKGNDFRLLIYQQLGDLYALLRQLAEHIRPQYSREESNLWKLLNEAGSRKSLIKQVALTGAVLERIEQINTIRTHLAGREEATKSRMRRLSRTQKHVRGALQALLELVPTGEEKNIGGTVTGLGESLLRHHDTLEALLDDNSFAHCARWARYHLRRARECLAMNNFKGTNQHIQKAIKHL
ncbi:hypothetical protein KKC62_03405 [Patescibacteria group bacterium]|nr:hypothetical protein [Patescibacteria group bacterium]MBU1953223.1 hypothetical protein [Patescibacteria group bacterium]